LSSRLEALARRVTEDPFFLGSALADYARSEGLDDAGLAAALGCSGEALARLRLCRRPDPAPERFAAEVERIASRFGARPEVVAEAVRRADALAGLRGPAVGERGLLMAARDRIVAEEEVGRTGQPGTAPEPGSEGGRDGAAEPVRGRRAGTADSALDETAAGGGEAEASEMAAREGKIRADETTPREGTVEGDEPKGRAGR
jgi:hypothetical protein